MTSSLSGVGPSFEGRSQCDLSTPPLLPPRRGFAQWRACRLRRSSKPQLQQPSPAPNKSLSCPEKLSNIQADALHTPTRPACRCHRRLCHRWQLRIAAVALAATGIATDTAAGAGSQTAAASATPGKHHAAACAAQTLARAAASPKRARRAGDGQSLAADEHCRPQRLGS